MSCNCGNGGVGSIQSNSSDCGGSNCGQTFTPGCTQQSCNSTCGCNSSQVVTPAPYYCNAPGVQECHQEVIVQAAYVTGLSTVGVVNMPACNQTTVLTIPGLQKISIGSFLWNPTYGYLEVMAFDYANAQVIVKNGCVTGNASPGTLIPSCTLFTVTDSPLTGGSPVPSTIYPFLAIDFVAPASGNCVTINVTNTNGLAIGQNVTLGGGVYSISDIVTSTQIVICNNGSGVTPGATVVALDGLGNYITPIVPVNASPCANTEVSQGSLIVCNNGVMQPLEAIAANMVPVSVGGSSNDVVFQALDIPTRVCTVLTVCLNLQPGTASYILTVASNADFQLGDKLYIGSDTATEYTVTNINADTIHMTVTAVPTPAAFVAYQPGTTVCWVGCCEQIVDLVLATETWKTLPCTWALDGRFVQWADYQTSGLVDSNGVDLTSAEIHRGGAAITTTTVESRLTNTSCKIMQVLAVISYEAQYSFNTNSCTDYAGIGNKILSGTEILFEPAKTFYIGVPGTGNPIPAGFTHFREPRVFNTKAGAIRANSQATSTFALDVAAGSEIIVRANCSISREASAWDDADITSFLEDIAYPLQCSITLIGVAGSKDN